jgi:hypothetical protein
VTPQPFARVGIGDRVERHRQVADRHAGDGRTGRRLFVDERDAVPDHRRQSFGIADRICDDRSAECHLVDVEDRRRDRLGQRRAEPRVELAVLVVVPLDHHAGGVGRVRERDVVTDARRQPDPIGGEKVERGIEVRDLRCDRAHVRPESRHEPIDGTAGDDRLADLEHVVTQPRHAAAAPDRRILETAVLEHPQAGDPDQRIAGALVVGDHRRRVEAPEHLMPAHFAPPGHFGNPRMFSAMMLRWISEVPA